MVKIELALFALLNGGSTIARVGAPDGIEKNSCWVVRCLVRGPFAIDDVVECRVGSDLME